MKSMPLLPKLVAVAALVLPYAVAPAQTLGNILKSDTLRQKIKPSELSDDMKAMIIVTDKQGGGGDFMSMLMNPMMMLMGSFGQAASPEGQGNPQQAATMAFMDRMSIRWTDGSAIRMFDDNYLVTYGVQINMAEIAKRSTPPDLSKEDLVLTLINTKSISTITPRLDMTKEIWMKPAPGTEGATEAGAKARTTSNMKQISTAMILYASDWDDVVPYAQSSKGAFEVMMPYTKSKELFISKNPSGSSILLNMAVAGVSMISIPEPAETVLFYESKTWPDGTRVVAFTDGHVKSVKPEEWERYARTLSLKLPKVGKPLPASLGANWDAK